MQDIIPLFLYRRSCFDIWDEYTYLTNEQKMGGEENEN